MWNSDKSTRLSTVCTKIIMALVIAFAVAFPLIRKKTALAEYLVVSNNEINYIVPILYLCCIIALVALFSLYKLLSNIRSENIFIKENVTMLRRISWCCFIAAAVLLFGSFFTLTFFLLSVMAGFIGLILRVVKNVFEAAVHLKTENDFTI